MFDLLDPITPLTLTKNPTCWMCTQCRSIAESPACAPCGVVDSIPYLDRRPFLLTKEARNSIVQLIDEAADLLSDMDIDDQCFYTGEYMPFLSSMLDEASRAEELRTSGSSGYRTTTLNTEEITQLLRSMKRPCR